MNESAPFCSQCGAPQIRVSLPAPAAQKPAVQTGAGSAPPPVFSAPNRVNWSAALPRTALAGFASVILLQGMAALIQSGVVLLIVLPLTGSIAVWLYRRADPLLNGSKGMRIGVVTGFFSFVVNFLVVAAVFSARKQEMMQQVKTALDQAVAKNPSPQAADLAQQLTSPGGMAALFTIMAILFFFIFLILCGIGGAIAGRSARQP